MKFINATITNSRLMGSMGLIICYDKDFPNQKLEYRLYLLDSEGLGLVDYTTYSGDNMDIVHREINRLIGGLGSEQVNLNEEEAVFLAKAFADKTINYGKLWPENFTNDEYEQLKKVDTKKVTMYDLFPKICKKIECDNEFINYMIMRFIARDKEALEYFSGRELIAKMKVTQINGSLLYNKIDKVNENSYTVEAIFEDLEGYYICKCGISIHKDDSDLKYRLDLILIKDVKPIGEYDVFMAITKKEYISEYSIINIKKANTKEENEKQLVKMFHNGNSKFHMIETEKGAFFTQFRENNTHVCEDIYVINNDMLANYYVIGNQIFAATYEKSNILLSDLIVKTTFERENIILLNSYEFEENVLYDFMESDNDSFSDFLY